MKEFEKINILSLPLDQKQLQWSSDGIMVHFYVYKCGEYSVTATVTVPGGFTTFVH